MADNSRYLDEKYSEGYNRRCKEIELGILVACENVIYELTRNQYQRFLRIRRKRDDWHKSLDYLQTNCEPIYKGLTSFNY